MIWCSSIIIQAGYTLVTIWEPIQPFKQFSYLSDSQFHVKDQKKMIEGDVHQHERHVAINGYKIINYGNDVIHHVQSVDRRRYLALAGNCVHGGRKNNGRRGC
jgi:hypothetical protein